MTYRIEFGPHIDWRKFKRLPNVDKKRLQLLIQKKLATQPTLFGKPLRSSLFPFWSLRVGDYRVIYRIERNIVHIELIGQRTDIYSDAEKWLV